MLVANLPEGSATWAAVTGLPREWTTQSFLLTDVFQGMTGEKHPGRPEPGAVNAAERAAKRTAALLDHQRRMAERDRELAEQEPTT